MTSVVVESNGESVNDRPSISVVMAVFNGDRFLRRQLDSLVSQVRSPDELVVVDDASQDGSLEILEEYAGAAPFPVQLLRNPSNRGSTESFGRALMASRCGFLALADQDDVWHPRKLEVLLGHLIARPDAMLAFSDARLIDEDEAPSGGTLWSVRGIQDIERIARDPFVGLISRRAISGATALFRREVVDAGMPFPQGMPYLHDGWLELVASSLGGFIAEPDPLMDYRIHSNQQLGLRIAKGDAMRSMKEKLGAPVRYRSRLEGLSALEEWLVAAPVPDTRRNLLITELREYRRHIEMRSSLAPRLHQRLLPVSRELATGRYRRWSNGTQSALKDLTGPQVVNRPGG